MNRMKKVFEKIKLRYEKHRKTQNSFLNSIKFKAFYSNGKKDKRSELAQILDYMFLRVFLFFLIFSIVFFKKGNLYYSIFLSLTGVSIYHYTHIKIRNFKMLELKKEKRKEIANQKIYKEILNKTVNEIKEYIIELFTKMNFKKIEYIFNDNKSIFFKSTYNKKQVIIYFTNKKELDVELKDLKEFLLKLQNYDLKRAIFITTCDFTQDCYRFLKELNEDYKIILINKDMFLSLIEDNEMFPTVEEIDEIIENKIIKRNRNWKKYKAIILSDNKKTRYLILSIYLAIAGLYMSYTVYYMIMSSITLFLFAFTLILNLKKQNTNEDSSWQNLKDLFENL